MGFDAIWISPVVDNLDNGYHGYWARNWEKINDNFGTADDLKDLVKAAHSKGMYVMVDVVANHVAPVGDDFSQVYPFNHSEHYHNKCEIQNWNDQNEVENCRLADLPDLSQQNDYVRGYLKNWIKNLVSTYEFDGIRIDTIPEVPKDFWAEYGQASGVFQMGECFNGDPAYVGPYQGALTGLFNYPMYYTIKDVFGGKQSMYGIKNRFEQEGPHFQDLNSLGIFVDNHDNARFLSQYNDRNMFKNALVFALTATGIPFYYYGSEQYYAGTNDPQNRESLWQAMNTESDLYKMTAQVNQARKAQKVWENPLKEQYVLDNLYVFSRGNFLVALTNQYDNVDVKVPQTPFSDGTTICNIFNTSDCQTVNGGNVQVSLNNGEAKIFVPQSSLQLDEAGDATFLQA